MKSTAFPLVLSMGFITAEIGCAKESYTNEPACQERYFQAGKVTNLILPVQCSPHEELKYITNLSLEPFPTLSGFRYFSYGSEDGYVTSTDRVIALAGGTIVRGRRYLNGGLLSKKKIQQASERWKSLRSLIAGTPLSFVGSYKNEHSLQFFYASEPQQDHVIAEYDSAQQERIIEVHLGNSPIAQVYVQKLSQKMKENFKQAFGSYDSLKPFYGVISENIVKRWIPSGDYSLLNLPPSVQAPSQNRSITQNLPRALEEIILA